ncbi:MAG: hypothetical protein CVU44_00135 [Chloroflexi bacterium HGW-Chloroflexi-6]|nr:MAG: hypothetical protein CVU44_00135 [Chloroflexi bacterium HGW-Chloroflexi-6]
MVDHQLAQDGTFIRGKNKSTSVYVIILGIFVGLGGIAHGVFETLQGNTPTGGYLLDIGVFTLIPNYLITGIAAIIVGLVVIVWTIGFIHTKNGSIIFLALSILLFCVGGGVAQVLFFILAWGVSTRINNPLAWWRKVLPKNTRKRLAQFWPTMLVSGFLFLCVAVGIWLILSPPNTTYRAPTIIEYVLWLFLAIGILLQPLAIVSGFARDIERQSA